MGSKTQELAYRERTRRVIANHSGAGNHIDRYMVMVSDKDRDERHFSVVVS